MLDRYFVEALKDILAVAVILCCGCCGDRGTVGQSNRIPFVPVLRERSGELVEANQPMKEPEFSIGLAAVLVMYNHSFVYDSGRNIILLPDQGDSEQMDTAVQDNRGSLARGAFQG